MSLSTGLVLGWVVLLILILMAMEEEVKVKKQELEERGEPGSQVEIIRHATTCSAPSSPNPTLLARTLKKEFDSVYGPAWHCVIGKSFGSFVTHTPAAFLYFSIDSFSVLLFKTQVQLLTQPPTLSS